MERIGRYEIVNHLASGGMGQVYLARSTGLGGFERKVVVKTLDSTGHDADAIEDDALVRMFLDEARLVGSLHHQYIAPVYEVGVDDEGRYYLVMDYVRGETAEAAWKLASASGSPPRLAFALSVVCAVASALEYAHELKAADGLPLEIVHRDVSLSNVMIGFDGGVKLIDFGIAKFARRTTTTQIGSLKGKLAYMSPEQVRSRPVDRRSDIFSLGIVLYELTTNTRAFDGPSELLMLEKITKGDYRVPSAVVPGYPRELERIVMKALELDPDDRYQDAGAMGKDLAEFAEAIGLTIGHASVSAYMYELFDATPPGGRRRLARASSEVDTGMHGPEVVELDDTTTRPHLAPQDEEAPTAPLAFDVDVDLVTPSIPTLALPERELVRELAAVPARPIIAPPVAPAVAARYARPTIPLRPTTSTEKVPRMQRPPSLPTAPARTWSWPALLITVSVVTALAVALVR